MEQFMEFVSTHSEWIIKILLTLIGLFISYRILHYAKKNFRLNEKKSNMPQADISESGDKDADISDIVDSDIDQTGGSGKKKLKAHNIKNSNIKQ